MMFRLALAVCVAGFWLAGPVPQARGAVVVVANRTGAEVRFTLTPPGGPAQPHALAAGDLAAIPVAGPAELEYGPGAARRARVDPDAAYYFADAPDGPDLKEIGLGDRPRVPQPARPADPPGRLPPPRVLTVKLLVDQAEPAARPAWEKRLRGRIDTASAVLERVCHVTLKVVAAEEWQSDDAPDLPSLLRDFERRVKPDPARVAIGFTSRRWAEGGDGRVGGTRPALHSHILLREWRPPTEGGRVEALLHELGHYLGAAHSAEPDSVMRPAVGDVPRAAANYRSRFDPVNALVMNLVAEEAFDRGVTRLGAVRAATRERLRAAYGVLARALPDDPTASQYLRQLGGPPAASGAP
jgi:hypothetical protein